MPTFDIPDNKTLARLVAKQHGVVSTRQLDKHGVSRRLAHARVRASRWQRPHCGVYAVFSGPLDRMATIWAAILRCGDGATASYETAAELEGLCDGADERVHVTIDERNRRIIGKPTGIKVHLSCRLPQTRHPAREPPRTRLDETVLDLVDATKTAHQAAGWITMAIRKRMTRADRLAAALALRTKSTWRAMIEAMLIDVAAGAQSPLELEHLTKVDRAHKLPHGERQQRRVIERSGGGRRVVWIDIHHRRFRTHVELDGRNGHEDDGAFRDRRRDNRGTVDGDITLRYGHAEVFGTPCEVAAEEAVVFQDRGWDGEPEPCSKGCPIYAVMDEIRAHRRAA